MATPDFRVRPDLMIVGLALLLASVYAPRANGQEVRRTDAVPKTFFAAGLSRSVRDIAPTRMRVTPRQAAKIVNRIRLIESLPSKRSEPFDDRYAKAIVGLGESAAPHLVRKLTDTTDSRVADLFQHKIGDVALALLVKIYNPPGYPFPDGAESVPAKYGDYRDYVEYFESPEARKRLQRSWENYLKGKKPGGEARGKEVGVKRNSKYGLTALFYRNSDYKLAGYEMAADRMIIRDDKTGRESSLVRLPDDFDNHQEVWSPDEEHLVFRCRDRADGFCVYAASGVMNLVGEDGNFGADKMSDFIRVEYTETSRPDKGQKKRCIHEFVKWEGDAAFVFKVRAYESKSGFGEFKYDAKERKLYGISSYSFDAENMRGKLLRPIRPGNVFRERGDGGND